MKMKFKKHTLLFLIIILSLFSTIGYTLAVCVDNGFFYQKIDVPEMNVELQTVSSDLSENFSTETPFLPGENKNITFSVKNTGDVVINNQISVVISMFDKEGNNVIFDTETLPFEITGFEFQENETYVQANNILFAKNIILNPLNLEKGQNVDGAMNEQDVELNISFKDNVEEKYKDCLIRITVDNNTSYYFKDNVFEDIENQLKYFGSNTNDADVESKVVNYEPDVDFKNGYAYEVNENNTITLTGFINGYQKSRDEIYIPSVFQGYVVEKIGQDTDWVGWGMFDDTTANKIYVPQCVKKLSNYLFTYNSNIQHQVTDIYFLRLKTQTEVFDTTFKYYEGKVHWPSGVVVSDEGVLMEIIGFDDSEILDLSEYKNIKDVGGVFYNCTKWKTIILPSSLEVLSGLGSSDGNFTYCTAEKIIMKANKSQVTIVRNPSIRFDGTIIWPDEVIISQDGILTEIVGFEDSETLDLSEYNIKDVGGAFYGVTKWRTIILPNTLEILSGLGSSDGNFTYCTAEKIIMKANKSQVTIVRDPNIRFDGTIIWPEEVIVSEAGVLTEIVGFEDSETLDLSGYLNIKDVGGTFYGVTKWKTIILPSSLEVLNGIGKSDGNFTYCTAEKIIMNAKKSQVTITRDPNIRYEGIVVWPEEVIITDAGVLTEIIGFENNETLDLSEYQIKDVGKALMGASKWKTIILPNTLEVISNPGIGYGVFSNCTAEKIIMKAYKSNVNIQKDPYTKYTGVIEWPDEISVNEDGSIITFLDGVKNISGAPILGNQTYSIQNNTNVAQVILPESAINIWNNAFQGCTNLALINIPDTVINVGSYAFNKCTSLTEVVLSKNLSTITNNSFDKTALLYVKNKEVDLLLRNYGYTNIKYYAFQINSLEELKAIDVYNNSYEFCYQTADGQVYYIENNNDSGIFLYQENTLIYAYPSIEDITYIIPDYISIIADNALSSISNAYIHKNIDLSNMDNWGCDNIFFQEETSG